MTVCKQEIIDSESGETVEQASRRGGRCPIPGNIQGQAGQGSEQPNLVVDSPAYCRGIDKITFNDPFQPKLLYDSMILCICMLGKVVILNGVQGDRRFFNLLMPF